MRRGILNERPRQPPDGGLGLFSSTDLATRQPRDHTGFAHTGKRSIIAAAVTPHTMIATMMPTIRPVLGIVHGSSSVGRINALQNVCATWLGNRVDFEYRGYVACRSNAFVVPSFRSWKEVATFSRCFGTPPFIGRCARERGGDMNEGAELATAGLVVACAAVLLVASHLFMESQSAKEPVKGSIDLKIHTNTTASWL
ncbi:hypothetical protein [Bradyrhizobium sp. AUGA SZCCT0042]|uniref:hypothetical protein n=1 Tax=Bradyrhizobium sp. AUGA SZCCT0042 TaxID=2807651 RepID=UPI0020135965|nr:hypothetical protein [Bradyrhizobium sp. AUGA SZCCT0042]